MTKIEQSIDVTRRKVAFRLDRGVRDMGEISIPGFGRTTARETVWRVVFGGAETEWVTDLGVLAMLARGIGLSIGYDEVRKAAHKIALRVRAERNKERGRA